MQSHVCKIIRLFFQHINCLFSFVAFTGLLTKHDLVPMTLLYVILLSLIFQLMLSNQLRLVCLYLSDKLEGSLVKYFFPV